MRATDVTDVLLSVVWGLGVLAVAGAVFVGIVWLVGPEALILVLLVGLSGVCAWAIGDVVRKWDT